MGVESDEGRAHCPFWKGHHEGFSEEGTFEQRPERGGRVSHMNISGGEEQSRWREQHVQRHEVKSDLQQQGEEVPGGWQTGEGDRR